MLKQSGLISLLLFLVIGCTHAPLPIEPEAKRPGVLDVLYYNFGYDTPSWSHTLVEGYAVDIRKVVPKGQSWELTFYSYSDAKWVSTFGDGSSCGGSSVIRSTDPDPDDPYSTWIWVGIVYHSDRCLTAFLTHPEFVGATYESIEREEIDHEFGCHIYEVLGVPWVWDVPKSCIWG